MKRMEKLKETRLVVESGLIDYSIFNVFGTKLNSAHFVAFVLSIVLTYHFNIGWPSNWQQLSTTPKSARSELPNGVVLDEHLFTNIFVLFMRRRSECVAGTVNVRWSCCNACFFIPEFIASIFGCRPCVLLVRV